MTEHETTATPRPASDLFAQRLLSGEARAELEALRDDLARAELLIVACGHEISAAKGRLLWSAWCFGVGVGVLLGWATGGGW